MTRAWPLVLALVLGACDPRPYAPPEVRSFVHATQVPAIHASIDALPQTTLTVRTRELGHVVAVRVAATPESRIQGLRDVATLTAGAGLLMVFPEDVDDAVTLESYKMPLDLAFVDGTGAILKIHSGLPCQTVPCTAYEAGRSYRAILHMEGGWFTGHEVAEGDRVDAGPLPAAS